MNLWWLNTDIFVRLFKTGAEWTEQLFSETTYNIVVKSLHISLAWMLRSKNIIDTYCVNWIIFRYKFTIRSKKILTHVELFNVNKKKNLIALDKAYYAYYDHEMTTFFSHWMPYYFTISYLWNAVNGSKKKNKSLLYPILARQEYESLFNRKDELGSTII